ncbi:hypothetical protein CLV35_0300 [Motilibacter peucedani]|uniref:Uncharacterized protein n=1 Tax=Motilibacter peucedani TaxID=598650 RepID=A0A420XUZ1_9ACTN|nr:hypothetical protein [Motilibacter peucedani]RKS80587.1 hypothetical protein CLV35_0300 [Motilibacter peucedani]
MDNDTAQAQVDEVRRAHLAASRPALPRSACVLAAACAGAGVALVAQGQGGGAHLAFLAAGVLCFAVAHLLPTRIRRRRGLHGYRGWTRTENTVLGLCALVLVICGYNADRDLALIFAGLGVVTAAAWYAMLRGVLVAGGRVRT